MSSAWPYLLTAILVGIAGAIAWLMSRRTARAKPPQRTVEDIQQQLDAEEGRDQ